MERRLAALCNKEPAYVGEPCQIHPAADRWTYSGECTACNPKNSGSYIDALNAIFGQREVTHQEAHELGLKMFRSGKACKHRHPRSWRYVSAPNMCLECGRLAQIKHRKTDLRRRQATARALGLARVTK